MSKIRQPEQKTPGILFLDMDGVLTTHRTCYAHGTKHYYHVDPIGLQMIDRLCAVFNLQIVVTSSWRMIHNVPVILKACGIKAVFHADWNTGCESGRGEEILTWLAAHPEVAKFIILDDEVSDIACHDRLRSRTVQTDQENGILWHHYVTAENMLKEMGADQ